MIRRYSAALRVALVTGDAASAVALFAVVSALRFGGEWDAIWVGMGVSAWLLAVTYGLAWVGALWLQGLYRLRTRWSARSELLAIARSVVLLAAGTFSALFWLKQPDVSRLFLLLLLSAQLVVTFASRLALRRLFAWLRARGYNTRFVLVVGAGPFAQAFADRIEGHPDLGLRVLGHLRWEGERQSRLERPILGALEEIERVLHERVVDEVAICLPVEGWQYVEPIARLCEDEGKVVRIPMDPVALHGGRFEDLDGVPVLSLAYGPDRVLSLALKRVLDVTLAGSALVVLSPVFLAVSAAIRLADGPPVVFRQARVGLHGRSFTLLKFRTMVLDAEARLAELEAHNEIRGHAFKVTDDPRLTRVGRILRRTSLDELPQFWNVLRGEMSIVGPRPPLPREVANYDIWHRRRLSMKPGITGLWQVQARREEDFDRWVEMDLAYIDRWSLWLDLKIMLRTIPAILQGQGR